MKIAPPYRVKLRSKVNFPNNPNCEECDSILHIHGVAFTWEGQPEEIEFQCNDF